jgi:hypothetical protein
VIDEAAAYKTATAARTKAVYGDVLDGAGGIIVEADVVVADQVGSMLADVMIEAFRDVLPNGPTRFLAIPGIGPTWAAAKADGERREKGVRASFLASRTCTTKNGTK